MPRFQLANCEVKLGGSDGHTVPKYGITPAEVAILSNIHGYGAVFNIEPSGTFEDIESHELLDRMLVAYARQEGVESPVLKVFPGLNTRLPETLAELRIPSDHLKSLSRVSIEPTVPSEPDLPDEDDDPKLPEPPKLPEEPVKEPVKAPVDEPKAVKAKRGRKAKEETKPEEPPAPPALFT